QYSAIKRRADGEPVQAGAQAPERLDFLFRAGDNHGVKAEQKSGQRRDDGPEKNTAVESGKFAGDIRGCGGDRIHVECIYSGDRLKNNTYLTSQVFVFSGILQPTVSHRNFWPSDFLRWGAVFQPTESDRLLLSGGLSGIPKPRVNQPLNTAIYRRVDIGISSCFRMSI